MADSFESALLQRLEQKIIDRGGSVPLVTVPSSFHQRHLELLDSLVSACGGLPVANVGNFEWSALLKLQSAIAGLGGSNASGLFHSFEEAYLQHLEALVTASGGSVPSESWPGSFEARALALVGAIAAGVSLDFSALPHLPTSQQARVAAAAGDQETIDSLAKLDVWIDPYAPIFTDAAGTTAATTGDPVGNVQCYATGNSYTKSYASSKPTLAAGPVLTGGYAKYLSGAPGATGAQKIIIATSDGILVADADLPSSFSIRNVPNTRGVFSGVLTEADITRLKAYAVAEGAVDNDFAAITDFSNYFKYQSYLKSFPSIDTSSVTDFYSAWYYCSGIISFSLLDVSSATSFYQAWYKCSSLAHFPANFFDGCAATNFLNAFAYTNLTQQSIDNILVSIESNGTSNGIFTQSDGSAPSATGEAAIDALRSRGWAVTVTGGY